MSKGASEEQELCFVTWNVCGFEVNINSKITKIANLSHELKTQEAEIVFLQETHIGPKNHEAFKEFADWHCFFTIYDPNSKGVAILINKNVSFDYICHDEDYSGGYLVLFCHLYGELFTLVSVYNHKNDKDILNRLRDYLQETAEGVLVVGGDFNTVLDVSFDRISTAKSPRHTQLRGVFETFTTSLNLLDTWAYMHPTDKEFTYSQNESFSRLDMFLLPEDTIKQVKDVKICSGKRIISKKSQKEKNISDHSLVLLTLTLREQSRKKNPRVALWLDRFRHIKRPDKRAGNINGAEILSVIKSLTDSGQEYPKNVRVNNFKMHCCPVTEILKTLFNHVLQNKCIPEFFKPSLTPGFENKLNLYSLIFRRVLAKRLNMLLKSPPGKKKNQINMDCYCVNFAEKTNKIRWHFLKKCLLHLLETCKATKSTKSLPPGDIILLEGLVHGARDMTEDFRLLSSILPEVSESGELRELLEVCPLTRPILSLVLIYLELQIQEKGYEAHTCHFRQVLFIHNTPNFPEDGFQSLLKEFMKESGIKMKEAKKINS